MYALISLWQLDEAWYEEQQQALRERIIPFVRQAPGFVEGYWTYNHSNGKSAGFTVLETADQAYDLKAAIERDVEAQSVTGVRLEAMWVQEIVGHVRGASEAAMSA